MSEFKVVDITDRESIDCPWCGFTIEVVPRIVDMDKQKHMELVKKIAKWKKKGLPPDHHGMANARIIICPECQKVVVGKDRFTVIY